MKKKLIEVFTAPGCGKCIKAKDVIQKVLPKFKNVKMEVKLITEEPERIAQLGVMTTPVVLIDGKLAFNKIPTEKEVEDALSLK